MELYVKKVTRDKDNNPAQWHIYSPYHSKEPLLIASLFNNTVMVAVLGFDNDAGFEFQWDEDLNIINQIRKEIKHESKAQRRIIQFGLFENE